MKKMKIFVVDDNQDFAEGLAEALELQGHEVNIASSGEEAIAISQKTNFDITFMDVKLPDINGVQSFLEIHKLKPNAKVVMMTGFSDKHLLDQALDNGAWGMLDKPFDMKCVTQILQDI